MHRLLQMCLCGVLTPCRRHTGEPGRWMGAQHPHMLPMHRYPGQTQLLASLSPTPGPAAWLRCHIREVQRAQGRASDGFCHI